MLVAVDRRPHIGKDAVLRGSRIACLGNNAKDSKISFVTKCELSVENIIRVKSVDGASFLRFGPVLE